MTNKPYQQHSFWHDTAGDDYNPRPRLEDDIEADIVIVGAGFTGLWAAYYLNKEKPDFNIVILEAEIAGFGASGRNGGWVCGALAGHEQWYANPDKLAGAIDLQKEMHNTVDEIGRIAQFEGIDCDYHKGGCHTAATSAHQRDELEADIEFKRAIGFSEEDYRWLGPDEAMEQVRVAGSLGARFSQHYAVIHPAKLARGLAARLTEQGVKIFEHSPVREITKGKVRTDIAMVKADMIVRATEGYTPTLEGFERDLIPIHSMMVATEPLSAELWDEIGLKNRETFGDARRLSIYGQRTVDGRIAFGSRGDYYFNSAIHNLFENKESHFEFVRKNLTEILPMLDKIELTHRWGGPLGVPRNFRPQVAIDRKEQIAWAGGYVGEGVAATNLAGRTLTDLILERSTKITDLPWVIDRDSAAHPARQWAPEPIRWMQAGAVMNLVKAADALDQSDSRFAKPVSKVLSRLIE